MTKRAPDRWLSAWDEYGESVDTGRIVQITAGILAPENDPAVAVSIAGETPITLTPDTVTRFQMCLDWAVEEHQTLILRAGDGQAADADTAVLDRAQWHSVASALQRSPGSHPEALDALRASAPSEWMNELGDPSHDHTTADVHSESSGWVHE